MLDPDEEHELDRRARPRPGPRTAAASRRRTASRRAAGARRRRAGARSRTAARRTISTSAMTATAYARTSAENFVSISASRSALTIWYEDSSRKPCRKNRNALRPSPGRTRVTIPSSRSKRLKPAWSVSTVSASSPAADDDHRIVRWSGAPPSPRTSTVYLKHASAVAAAGIVPSKLGHPTACDRPAGSGALRTATSASDGLFAHCDRTAAEIRNVALLGSRAQRDASSTLWIRRRRITHDLPLVRRLRYRSVTSHGKHCDLPVFLRCGAAPHPSCISLHVFGIVQQTAELRRRYATWSRGYPSRSMFDDPPPGPRRGRPGRPPRRPGSTGRTACRDPAAQGLRRGTPRDRWRSPTAAVVIPELRPQGRVFGVDASSRSAEVDRLVGTARLPPRRRASICHSASARLPRTIWSCSSATARS